MNRSRSLVEDCRARRDRLLRSVDALDEPPEFGGADQTQHDYVASLQDVKLLKALEVEVG
jgi:hypothetical protein